MPTDDDDIPAPGPAPERPSPDAYELANLAGCFSSVAVRLQEVAGRLDSLTGDERRAFATLLERQLADAGECAHEARRLVGEIVRGG